MTWSIGVCSGSEAVVVADACVTFGPLSGGVFLNCLQKLHVIGSTFLFSFSGSVRIGFAALDAVRTRLEREIRLDPTYSVREAALSWAPRLLGRVMEQHPDVERQHGLSVLLAGPDAAMPIVWPSVSYVAVPRAIVAPQVNVYRLQPPWRSAESALNPSFAGSQLLADLRRLRQVLSIGSGTSRFARFIHADVMDEAGTIADRAESVRRFAEMRIRPHINQGVSPELSTGWVTPLDAVVQPPRVTDPFDERPLPSLCTTYPAFLELARRRNFVASAACC